MADNENLNTEAIEPVEVVHGLDVGKSLLGATLGATAADEEEREPDEEYETIPVAELLEVKLGRQGENDTQTVVIDCSAWLTQLPGCTLMIAATRPGEREIYLPEVTVDSGVVTWPILEQDTACAGTGRAEVRAMLNDKIKKSALFRTRVEPALEGDGSPDAPTPPNWVKLIIGSVEEAQAAAEHAEELVDEATACAINAVRFDEDQGLTEAQKAIGRGNIDAASVAALEAQATATAEALAGKVALDQGVAQAGKAMVVGPDGNVTTGDAVQIDDTLQQAGQAADAAAVGAALEAQATATSDALAGKVAVQQGVAQAGKALVVGSDGVVTTGDVGIPEAVKVSLLNIFRHVAYADDQGDVYYTALAEALGVTPVVPSIYATLNLGAHDVYPTDNINSLRNYLTVIDDEGADIDDYEIDGSISSVGTNTIVVRRGTDTADVEVPVKANTRGLLYEWNLTDSLTDLRQLITATLHTGEGWEIPGKSEGTTPPIQGSTGVVFNDAQQLVRFLPSDMETTQFLKNKTVQVDVAEFNFTYGIGNTTEIRFIAFLSENSDNYRVAETGIFYGNMNKVDSGVTGWGLRHIKSAATTGYNRNAVSGQPSDISGHTVSVYFDNNLRGSMYIDGTLKKAYTESLADPTVYHTYGFQIGAGGRPAYGGCFYNARITGVRIYDGNAAQ